MNNHALFAIQNVLCFYSAVVWAGRVGRICRIFATVCGMCADNIKALELLGVTKMKPFFRFHNQESASVFGPPPSPEA